MAGFLGSGALSDRRIFEDRVAIAASSHPLPLSLALYGHALVILSVAATIIHLWRIDNT